MTLRVLFVGVTLSPYHIINDMYEIYIVLFMHV